MPFCDLLTRSAAGLGDVWEKEPGLQYLDALPLSFPLPEFHIGHTSSEARSHDMINMMTNTGLIEIGGQEHGGKGWKDRIWRGQQKIFSPFYFVFFFSSALFWLFWIITGLFSNKIPSFISLGIHALLFIVSIGSDISSLEVLQFWVFLLTLAMMACFLGFMFIC